MARDGRAPAGRPAAARARARRDARRLARDAADRARPARGGGRDHPPPGLRAPTSARRCARPRSTRASRCCGPTRELAERRGVRLSVRDLEIADAARWAPRRAEAFGLDARHAGADDHAHDPRRRRAGGDHARRRAARARAARPSSGCAARVEGGGDGARRPARRTGVQVAFAVTRVRPRLSRRRASPPGARSASRARPRCSSSRRSCTSRSGEAVQHSSDLFAPGGIDLQVRRNLEVAAPRRRSCAPSRLRAAERPSGDG